MTNEPAAPFPSSTAPDPPPGRPDRRRAAMRALVGTAEVVMTRIRERLASVDLTCSQYQVLCRLAEAGEEGLPCGQLGDSLFCRDPDLTRLADRLVKAGWVRRERCEADRRVVRLGLTAAGAERLQQAEPVVQEALAELFGGLSEEDLRALEGLLGRLGGAETERSVTERSQALQGRTQDESL